MPQLSQQRLCQSPHLTADTNGYGGDVPQVGVDPLPQHRGAAHAHPEAAPGGEIAPAQGLPGGIPGIIRHRVAQLLQVRLGHGGALSPLSRRYLPLRQQHRQTVPRPQPEFLRPSLVRLRQLHGDPPQAAGQDGRRQFIARLTFSSFQGSSLLLLLLQCMTAPARICQMKKVGVPHFSPYGSLRIDWIEGNSLRYIV